jgi:hypothetical protein
VDRHSSKLRPVTAGLTVRWLGTGATWLLSIGAGISLLVGHGGGLFLLAFGLLLGIALQVAAAWTRSSKAPGSQSTYPPTSERRRQIHWC